MPGKRTGPGGLSRGEWDMVTKLAPLNQKKKKPLTRNQRIAGFEKALNARFKKDGLPVRVK